MSVTLKSYPKYKDSGVPWLMEVPEHWETAAVKRHYSIQLGKMLQSRPIGLSDEEVPYLKAQHVQWFAVRISEAPRMWASPQDVKQFTISAGDLLVCEGGEGGRCGILREDVGPYIIQNALHRVRPLDQCQNEFLQYVMSTIAAIGWFDAINNKATIAHFTKEKFGALGIPIPTKEEQAAIVRFLDHYDRKIRRFIHAKQKLIKLLEEQKQAIIIQAVTRGLDPNVRLKPSGVEWLGDVPEHWEIRPAKYFYREVDERSITGDEELLSVSHITGVTPRKQKNVTMFMPESYAGSKLCQPNDLVINTMWAWMAALGVSNYTGIVSPAYGVYRPIKEHAYIGDFVDLLLRTKPYVGEYICRSTGIRSSRLRLYPECFLRIKLIRPPQGEQLLILAYIQEETENLDLTIQRTQREIDLIREYRTRLIADVVTGKLDIRNVPIEEPEESEELSELDDVDDESSISEEVGELEDADN